jgi:hypothetical protein
MLNKVSELESKLTPEELSDRIEAFSQLRAYLERAAQSGGVPAYIDKNFPYPPQQIRVDLQVITGKAGVPDKESVEDKNGTV